MTITSQTKYADFADCEYALTDESKAEIMRAAEQQFKGCYDLTIDEFFGITDGNYELLGDLSDPSVLQVYWIKRFEQFCEEFAQACERMRIEPTTEEKAAQVGCLAMTPQESMLVFTREYFVLHSFFEAGQRTIGEYLTARKDRYNAQRTQRNYNEQQKKKLKNKR